MDPTLPTPLRPHTPLTTQHGTHQPAAARSPLRSLLTAGGTPVFFNIDPDRYPMATSVSVGLVQFMGERHRAELNS